eukprot:1153418-Pelagomonas_calceolata.AAC.3
MLYHTNRSAWRHITRRAWQPSRRRSAWCTRQLAILRAALQPHPIPWLCSLLPASMACLVDMHVHTSVCLHNSHAHIEASVAQAEMRSLLPWKVRFDGVKMEGMVHLPQYPLGQCPGSVSAAATSLASACANRVLCWRA